MALVHKTNIHRWACTRVHVQMGIRHFGRERRVRPKPNVHNMEIGVAVQ